MAGSRPLSAPEDTQYSTLEVDHNNWLENDRKAAPMVGQDPKDEKILTYNDVGNVPVVVDPYNAHPESSLPTEERRILGLRRKTFFILLPVVLILIVACAVGGGVGHTIAARNREQTTSVPTDLPPPTPTRGQYANTGLAAMQWTDLGHTLHKRLYYQDNSNRVRESAWENSTTFDTAWKINIISDAVKPGTPIAALAGYPHASYNYSLVRIDYLSIPTTINTTHLGQECVLHVN